MLEALTVIARCPMKLAVDLLRPFYGFCFIREPTFLVAFGRAAVNASWPAYRLPATQLLYSN